MKYTENDMNGSEISRLFKIFANLMDKSTPQELSDLLNGKSNLVIVSKRKKTSDQKNDAVIDIEIIAKKLEKMESREAGENFLSSIGLPRRELENLSRYLLVPILKTDNIERLFEKIIENSIGARLNSVAIRGFEGDS
jgi:hypothetical protein